MVAKVRFGPSWRRSRSRTTRAQGHGDLMGRIEADGSRSVGRFIDQRWRPVGAPQDPPANMK